MQQPDYAGLLDRLEVAISRMHKTEVYSARRRQRYHDLAQEQLKFLRQQLE